MDEQNVQNDTAINEVSSQETQQATPPVEAAPQEQSQSEGRSEPESEVNKAQTMTDDSTPSPSAEEGHKPTRAERRIKQLTQKIRESTKPVYETGNHNGFPYDQKPQLITQDDIEQGGVDPRVLEQRQQERENALRAQMEPEIEKRIMQNIEYRKGIEDSLTDLEAVQKQLKDEGNEDLEDFIAEQYHRANHVINPMTGQEVFIPRVKASQLLANLRAVVDKRVTRTVAGTQIKLQKRQDTGALSPASTTGEVKKNLSEMSREDLWANAESISRDIDNESGF